LIFLVTYMIGHYLVSFPIFVLLVWKIGWTKCWCQWFWIQTKIGHLIKHKSAEPNLVDEANCHGYGHFILHNDIMDQLGMPCKKVKMIFLEKHDGINLNFHELVCYGGSKHKWVVVTFVPINV
jgi:hypothetical protein